MRCYGEDFSRADLADSRYYPILAYHLGTPLRLLFARDIFRAQRTGHMMRQ